MAGLVPAIHVLDAARTWMPGTRPGMTKDRTMTPSRIQRLSLAHFRNYRAASMQARGDVVVLIGPNGAGKTNAIEAISFLSPGRGLRRATLDDVADNQGDGSWAVSAEVEGALGLATLGTGIDAPGSDAPATSRRCRIDRDKTRGDAARSGRSFRVSVRADHARRLDGKRAAQRARYLGGGSLPGDIARQPRAGRGGRPYARRSASHRSASDLRAKEHA